MSDPDKHKPSTTDTVAGAFSLFYDIMSWLGSAEDSEEAEDVDGEGAIETDGEAVEEEEAEEE